MRKKRQNKVRPQLVFKDDVENDVRAPASPHTRAQRVAQNVVTFADMMATGTMTIQNLSMFNIPTPIQGILAASSAALMGAMHDIGAAVTQSSLCIRGQRSAQPCTTVVKESAATLVALAAAAGAGYGLTVLNEHYAPQLKASSNETIQSCGYLLTDAAVMGPILAAIGYVGYRGVRALGLTLGSYCVPGGVAAAYQPPGALQKFGQVFHRIGVDVAVTEIILSQLKHWGHFSLGADPRLQMGIFLGTDVAFNLLRHAAYVPQPITSLVPQQQGRPIFLFDEEMGTYPPPAPSARDKTLAVVKCSAINTLLSGGAYALSELVCALSATALVCEDTALYRAARFAIPSTLLATKCAVEVVAPTVSKTLSRCWSSLFTPAPERDDEAEERELLLAEPNSP